MVYARLQLSHKPLPTLFYGPESILGWNLNKGEIGIKIGNTMVQFKPGAGGMDGVGTEGKH